MSETPEQCCVNQEYAETIKTHPESWKAWKREAERLQSFISHACMIEIACENPSVKDHMVHWEGRAIKAEAALSAAEQRVEAMGKEDTVESLGDWQYLSDDDGWITCPDRAAAEREQKTLNTVIRYVRYYHLAAIASGAGESA